MKHILEKFTKISFISLATLPLIKPNHNSILIILCTILTLYYFFKSLNKPSFKIKNLGYCLPFFLFLLYEILANSYNTKLILLNLPFLIFPLLFYYRPRFIDYKVRNISLVVFQVSVVLQAFIFLLTFLHGNTFTKLFFISKENIPFFREYVTNNYLFEIHPTYFSAFLLVSITISLFRFKKSKIAYTLNVFISIFFLVLFSSRIILLLLLLTLVSFVCYQIFLRSFKNKIILTIGIVMLVLSCTTIKSTFILKRFQEVRLEINKPIVGKHYNSTNTRVAIYRCDLILANSIPFWGYGSQLQEQLNTCFANTNESDFYKISVFNTHNYYFNMLLYGGLLFLLAFLFYLYFICKNLRHSLLGLSIFLQFLFINLTENYLSRHYGIVLFCYFTCLFIFFKNEKTNAATKHL